MACEPRAATVLGALQRRLRWHPFHGDDNAELPFEAQAQRIVGAFFWATHASDDEHSALKNNVATRS